MLKMTSQVAEAASVVQGTTEWSQLNVSECENCKAPVKPEWPHCPACKHPRAPVPRPPTTDTDA